MSGGGKGGEEETKQVQQPKFEFAPASSDVIWNLHDTTMDLLKQPLHPLQQESLAAQQALARQGGQLLPGATDALGNIIGGGMVNPALAETQRIAMGGDVGSNPWLDAAYRRGSENLVEQLNQVTNPSLDIAAAQAGRSGGGLHALLRNQAGEQVGEQLTDLATGIYGGAYESDQARRMAALGQLGGLGQQDVANRLAAAGAAPGFDAARFADAERLYQLGQTEQLAPYQIGQTYANFLGAVPSTVGGTTTTKAQQGSGGGGAQGALSGAAGGAAMGTAIMPGWGTAIGAVGGGLLGYFSDERLKEDIEPVGITFGGTPLYSYKYKDDPDGPTQIGALAQEIALDQPEAVFLMPNGFLGIDYGKVK